MSFWDSRRDLLGTPKITPLDNTVLSQMLFFNSSNSPPRRLKELYKDIHRCVTITFQPETVCIPARVFKDAESRKTEIANQDPAVLEGFDRWNVLYAEYSSGFNVQSKSVFGFKDKSAELRSVEMLLAGAIYRDASKDLPILKGWIWFAHVFALLIGLILIYAREHVGAMILWPLSLFVSGLRKGAKAAKDLHEKV